VENPEKKLEMDKIMESLDSIQFGSVAGECETQNAFLTRLQIAF
jgi:hypothetical protein